MDSVSNFSFVSRFCARCGHQTNRTCAVDEAFCPILWTVQNLGIGRNFTQLEVLNVLLIANHLLCFSTEGIVRAMCLQITDWCIFVRVIFDLMHWPLLISRIRSSSCSTAACGIPWVLNWILSSVFPSSTNSLLVLALRCWASSRWTCQDILQDNFRRGNKETFWYRISSVLVFTTLSTQSAGIES